MNNLDKLILRKLTYKDLPLLVKWLTNKEVLNYYEGKANIKLKLANTDYFNSLLKELSKITDSAGNKCREVLFQALGDAKENNYLKVNPIELTDKYQRNKPKITIYQDVYKILVFQAR